MTFVHIRNITVVTVSILGQSLTDANTYGDICPVNICPGDICPYQEYLCCYQHNFGQILKVVSKIFFDFLFVELNKFLDPKFFWIQSFLGAKLF